MTLFARYDAGERRAVWDEIHTLGSLDGITVEHRLDIEAVAHNTMMRAASNFETIQQRLVRLGFHFDDASFAFARVGPRHALGLRSLAKAVGEIPVSLTAMFEIIGDISFRGWLPSWGTADEWYGQFIDPFEFLPDVDGEIERVNDADTPAEDRGFRLEISGDYLHKNVCSGGAATFIPLPNDEADARVVEDDGVCFKKSMKNLDALVFDSIPDTDAALDQGKKFIWLIDYLRMYFDAGGFRRVPGTVSYPEELIQTLSTGLLEI